MKVLTAEKLARMYLERCVAFFGIPQEIMSDNDHLIGSKFFQTLCRCAGIEQKSSILYRPRGNGGAEVAVQHVSEMLRQALVTGKIPWVQALPWVLHKFNDLP